MKARRSKSGNHTSFLFAIVTRPQLPLAFREGVYHRQSAAEGGGINSMAGKISAFLSPYLFAHLNMRTASFYRRIEQPTNN
jgi:hypothetical protein